MAISMKAARVNAGLTQEQLAEKLGVSPVTIWKWEHGQSEPKFSQFKKLCEAVDIDMADIFIPTT